MKRVLPPPVRTTPAIEPSAKMRPEPVEPSKQVNANSLPATKWRAASAFSGSARAGAAKVMAVKTAAARTNMIYSPLTIPTKPSVPDDRGQILKALLDLDHDSAPNAAVQNRRRGHEHTWKLN